MDRNEVTEAAILLVLTLGLLIVGIRLARAFAAVLAWALWAVQ